MLVVDTSDIDFVHNEGDLKGLLGAIDRARQGTQHYLPMASKRAG
jgi:hypothetical protein